MSKHSWVPASIPQSQTTESPEKEGENYLQGKAYRNQEILERKKKDDKKRNGYP